MSSVWYIGELDLTIRMIAATAMGGLIGFEREWNNHAAGLRTHMLVCTGSAAIMLLSIYGFSEFADEFNVRMDPARLAAQVITGVGFLGAGAIMRNGSTVSGLTTAASIWVVAAIGLCIGAGSFYLAGLSTFIVLVSLFLLNKLEKRMMRNRRTQEVTIQIYERAGILSTISNIFAEQEVQIKNLKYKHIGPQHESDGVSSALELKFNVITSNREKMNRAIENISKTNDVISLESHQYNIHLKMDSTLKSHTM